jgi:hypothetical protein
MVQTLTSGKCFPWGDPAKSFPLLSNLSAIMLLISTANDLVVGILQQALTKEPPLWYA